MHQTKILKVMHDGGRPALRGGDVLFQVAEGSYRGMRGTVRELGVFVGATSLDESCFVSYETGRIIMFEIAGSDTEEEQPLTRKVKI